MKKLIALLFAITLTACAGMPASTAVPVKHTAGDTVEFILVCTNETDALAVANALPVKDNVKVVFEAMNDGLIKCFMSRGQAEVIKHIASVRDYEHDRIEVWGAKPVGHPGDEIVGYVFVLIGKDV